MNSSTEYKPLGTFHGRSGRKFKFYWHKENHHVYVETTGFFGSATKTKTGVMASSWEMAYHAAEAYVHER